MSPQKVVDAINEAYSNKIYQEGSRGVYVGSSKEGIKIRMVLTDDGKIITAYLTVSE
ncbi:putative cytosolic protein [Streptococcus gordonii]|uniref:Putative cytosolic protein n=1 Tax=Streptococcus gordonii TaxID=1302 RepID=A0A139MWR0_STRGN|nr:putative cytosolic protein [Streptococcus gordonii]